MPHPLNFSCEYLVYALCDPRTHRVRYIGASARGLLRPISHRFSTHNRDLAAWLQDLRATGHGYTTVVLASARDEKELAELEARWIVTGQAMGWPLVNKNRPAGGEDGALADVPPEPPSPAKKWDAKAWRRDPEVRQKLAEARAGRKKKTKTLPPDFRGSILGQIKK